MIKELRLVKPYVNLTRDENFKYNFQDLIDEFMSGPSGPTPRFALKNIEVIDGKIDFDDRPEQTKHAISNIKIGVPFISSIPSQVDIRVQPAFSALINGSPLVIDGETKPFKDTLESHFHFNLDNLSIPKYLSYSPVELNFKVPSGQIDGKLTASFKTAKGQAAVLALSGNVIVQDLVMQERRDTPLLKLPALEVGVEVYEVFAGKAIIKSVKFQGLDLHVRRGKDGAINLANLVIAPPGKTAPEPQKASAPFSYGVGEILLESSKLNFSDDTPAKAYRTQLNELRIAIKGLTNEPGKKATAEISFQSDANEDFKYSADLQLSPLAVNGQFDIQGFRVGPLLPYYQEVVNLEARGGLLNLSGAHSLIQTEKELLITVSNLNAAFSDLSLYLAGNTEPLWRVPSLLIKDTSIDVNNRKISMAAFESRGGKGSVVRETDGTINYARLFKTSSAPEQPKAAEGETPWQVTVRNVALTGYGVVFDDQSLATPAKLAISDLSWRQENISNARGARGKMTIQAKINDRGVLRLTGSAGTNPIGGKVAIEAGEIALAPFQPYVADQINFLLTAGQVGAKGALAIDGDGQGPLKITYDGALKIADLATVEKSSANDLLKWNLLALDGLHFELDPMRLRIDEINLSDFFSRLIIAADGKINLQNLTASKAGAKEETAKPAVAEKPPQAADAAPPALEKQISIGKINLSGGNINFSDFFIKPNYSANLTGVQGVISELKPEAPGDLALLAKLDNAAPVDIHGKINPLSKELFMDIVADAREIELSPFSAYSGKYVGYGIEKGKLSFNVKYKVENRKLDADNKIILNQLTFGDKVESPDATKLPVLLAVALLKDRNGVIDINLPIGGSLDDPKFSVGGIVWQLILNILVKAVTSPFALLGAVFGGGSGEELSFVEFDPGRAALAQSAEAKIKTLSTAMNDRPGLKLEISGRVDPVNDLEGLKKIALERKIKAQKLKDLARQGTAPKSVDEVQIAAGEYERYLKAAYGEESFPKPRNLIGLAKDLPAAETESLMLKYIQVNDDDLRDLAGRRAQAVRDRLLSLGQVTVDRVFIVAAKPAAEDEKNKAKARTSRVDFSLR